MASLRRRRWRALIPPLTAPPGLRWRGARALALLALALPVLLGACGVAATPAPGKSGGWPVAEATATATVAVASPPKGTPPSPIRAVPPSTGAGPAPISPATGSPPAAPPPRFGMTTHFMWYDTARAIAEMDRLRAGGMAVVRFDVGWRWVEPRRKGDYDVAYLERLDAVLAAAAARDLLPIVALLETPEWARPAGTGLFHPPTRRQDYGDALGMLAGRYADRPSMIWEVWNEPNIPEFWGGGAQCGRVYRPAQGGLSRGQGGRPGCHGPRRCHRLQRPQIPAWDVR